MPLVKCTSCFRDVELPDSWTSPGFTCPFCHKAISFALPSHPKIDNLADFRHASGRNYESKERSRGNGLLIAMGLFLVVLLMLVAWFIFQFSTPDEQRDLQHIKTLQSSYIDAKTDFDMLDRKIRDGLYDKKLERKNECIEIMKLRKKDMDSIDEEYKRTIARHPFWNKPKDLKSQLD